MWGDGLEKVEELLRKQNGRESFPGMTHSGTDQQHRTTFGALAGTRSSYKPAVFMDSGFSVEAAWETLRGGARSLFDG